MGIQLIVVLCLGVLLLCALMAYQTKWYGISPWKSVPIACALVATGVIGSEIWFCVENGFWGGRSLYGAIVFSPIVFLFVAKILRIKYAEILDFVAPGGCLVLALVKIQCLRDHCCEGMVLYIDENHMYVRFPSQIVEMATFLIISALLFYMSSKSKYRGKIFPWFLVIYGVARFCLDFLRETIPSYLFGLSAGAFWSLCSFVVGLVILIAGWAKEKRSEELSVG